MKTSRMKHGYVLSVIFFTLLLGPVLKSMAQQSCCDVGEKPQKITLRYTGDDCSETNTTQDPGKYSCSGNANGDESVYIIANDNTSANSGKVWFTGVVSLDSLFTIDAANGGDTKFASNTYIHIFNQQGGTKIQTAHFHTSCSQPLLIGEQWGAIELVGTMDANGVTCGDSDSEPVISCCEDGFKPASITFTYTGEGCSATSTSQSSDKYNCSGTPNFDTEVYIISNDNSSPTSGRQWFSGNVKLDSAFTILASKAGEDKFPSNTYVHVYNQQGGNVIQTINFHTSCSQPLNVGDQWGAMKLEGMVSDDGAMCGTPEEGEEPGISCCADGFRPQKMTMQFTGEDCSATSTVQTSGYSCSGNPSGHSTVYIISNDNSNPNSGKIWFSGQVFRNGYFTLNSAAIGETKLSTNTYFHVFDHQGGQVLQTVYFHTSCSQPLVTGDQWGGLKLKYMASANGAECGTPISNNSFNIINGYTYYDANVNQVFNTNEPDISGMKVTLYRDNDCNGAVNTGDDSLNIATTNSNGFYEFITPYGGGPYTKNYSISTGNNDAEEKSDGIMDFTRNDLEFNSRTVGLHLKDIDVPQGAIIEKAYILFECSKDESGTAVTRIFAQNSTDAPAIGTSQNYLTTRNTTTAFKDWNMASWDKHESYITPDVKNIVQELVNKTGWVAGNDVTFIIKPLSGNGKRKAESFNGSQLKAPKLVIEYSISGYSECYVTKVDTLTEPNLNSPTTDILETAVFTSGGNIDSMNNFGFFGQVPDGYNLITGSVFADADENGEFNQLNEIGLENLEVTLYRDVNCNNELDAGDIEQSSIPSASNGFYSFVVPYAPESGEVAYMVTANNDDAEQKSDGKVDVGHDHLHLNERRVGMQFKNVQIPQGAVVTSAYIKFYSDNDEDQVAQVRIFAENSSNPQAYQENNNNLSNRSRTASFANWSLNPWSKNVAYYSPNISAPLQELFNRGDWNSGNTVSILIDPLTGGGKRKATAHDDIPAKAPKLFIEYTLNGNNDCYLTRISNVWPQGYDHLTTDSLNTQVFTSTNQVDSLNDFGLWGPEAVPVELLSFIANWNYETAELHWVTASEENNSHFEIERSFDGVDFEKVGMVESKAEGGNSLHILNYRFLDYNVLDKTQNIVYYRLRQVDFDGAYEYSPTVALIKRKAKVDGLTLYPNPANTTISLSMDRHMKGERVISLVNLNGQVVYEESIKLSEQGFVQIDVSSFDRGMYYMVMKTVMGDVSWVGKVVIEH